MSQYRNAASDQGLTHENLQHDIQKADTKVLALFSEYTDEVVKGLISIAHLLAPQAIILGGAISESEYFITQIKQKFKSHVMKVYQDIHIVPAKCGNLSALLGMAYLLNK